MNRRLSVIPFNGLNADCLGNYLAALGLISVAQKQWPSVRACWRKQHIVLLVPPGLDKGQLTQHLLTTWQPMPFRRWWDAAFNEDRSAAKKRLIPLALNRERSKASRDQVRVLDATVVVHQRPVTNPLLGPLAGKVSDKRNFESAHVAAIEWITTARTGDLTATGLSAKAKAAIKRFQERSDSSELVREWLAHTLFGLPARDIPHLAGAGTWFGIGNRSYNNGQEWYREGHVSPWSVLFAMQGVFQLVGGIDRKLGSRSRPYAVYPFMSDPGRPESEAELTLRREGEFWAPLWEHPATHSEIRSLFKRGQARLGTRSASAPHEFAVAAMSVGADSSVTEFARFELRQTTTAQVYESIPRGRVSVSRNHLNSTSPSTLLVQLIESGWIDRLPRDTIRPRKFFGLRGPVEAAIVQLAERPENAERWQELLLRLASVQARMDRNKKLRERCTPLTPLSPAWFSHAWPTMPPEIAIAKSIASVGWHFKNKHCDGPIPLLANVFGVTLASHGKKWRSSLPKIRPAQAVWGSGDPLQALLDVAQRRLVDAEGLPSATFAGTRFVSAELVRQFLDNDGGLDLDEIAKWVPPLALIDWSQATPVPFRDSQLNCSRRANDGAAMLHALVRPLFHVDYNNNVVMENGEPLFRSDQMPKANLLRRLFHLLRFGAIDEAIQVLRDRYLAVGRAIVMPPNGLIAEGERIAAALLIPMSTRDVVGGLKRWLHPSRNR